MRQAVAVVVVVVVLTAGAIALLAPGGDGGDGPTPTTTSTTLTAAQEADRERARGWNRAMAEALDPLNETIPELLRETRSWADGQLDDDGLRPRLEVWRGTLLQVAAAVGGVGPLEGAPLALPGHRVSLDLYVGAVGAYEAAVDVPPGALREEVVRVAQRIRTLADRVFDRGQAAVDGLLREGDDPSIEVREPEEVPSWPAEDLAPGPPLAEPADPPAERFPTRAAHRPVQPRGEWLDAVAEAGPAGIGDVATAVEAGDADDLGRLADSLLAAAEVLREEPDPEGPTGREESARFRLGLLVRAEGARSAQAAAVVAGDSPPAADRLRRVARTLLDAAATPLLDPVGGR